MPRSKRSLLFLALFAGGCVTASDPRPPELSLKITNARIVDGTGAPWFRGDVGVRGDTIVAVGDLQHRTASTTIDAKDRVLSPGFIDLLGQSQGSVFVDPTMEAKIRQGVTTEITGEGHSPAPINERMAADRGDDAPQYRTLGDWFRALEQRRPATNFGLLVGASNPRSMVIGAVNRAATEDELQQMERIVGEAMRDGAIGISTSLIYVPAVFSSTEEIIRLARVAAEFDGMYFTHIRNEGDRIDSALDEAFRIGREANIPLNIWHLKTAGKPNWGRMPAVVARIAAERAKGLDVSANVYPYVASATSLSSRAPDWALEGGYKAFQERLKDPVTRARIAEELTKGLERGGGGVNILVARLANEEQAAYQRKRLSEIAGDMQVSETEAMIRLFETNPTSPAAVFFSMDESDLRHALATPWISVGADSGSVPPAWRSGGAHPRAYGTFPRVVGHYVRDVKLFSMEEAVRKLTSQAAQRAHLYDRGLVRAGMKADLIVFDPDTIRDVSTFEDPHHFSEGVYDVVVNGTVVLRDGTMTGERPGRILRGRGWNGKKEPK
jgi:N-acyl-D-amino-acid deacylase